jgi:hypothetical protein
MMVKIGDWKEQTGDKDMNGQLPQIFSDAARTFSTGKTDRRGRLSTLRL